MNRNFLFLGLASLGIYYLFRKTKLSGLGLLPPLPGIPPLPTTPSDEERQHVAITCVDPRMQYDPVTRNCLWIKPVQPTLPSDFVPRPACFAPRAPACSSV